MCAHVVRLFMAFFVCGCGLFALPAKASTVPPSHHATAHEAWAAAGVTPPVDAALDEHPTPVTGESQADPADLLRAGLAVLEPALLMAQPPAWAVAALRSRHPDSLQRPPCRVGIAA